MPQNTHIESTIAEGDHSLEQLMGASDLQALRAKAEELKHLAWIPDVRSSEIFSDRYAAAGRALQPVLRALETPLAGKTVSEDFRWLYDNVRLVYAESQNAADAVKRQKKLPHVRAAKGVIIPRVLALAEAYLSAAGFQFNELGLTFFVEVLQQHTILEMSEIWALVPALRLILVEQIVARGMRAVKDPTREYGVGVCIRSLRDLGHISWKEILEPLVLFDRVLRQDPADTYARMDFESRDLYRNSLANIAEYSDLSEIEVARECLALAQAAQRRPYSEPRIAQREAHVGYYLVDKGTGLLHERVGFSPPLFQKLRIMLRRHPDEFFLPAIEVLTFAIMSAVVLLLSNANSSLGLVLFSMLILLLPSSQSAVQLVNYLTTALFTAEILPKLDFFEGVPENCITLVAVPSLLLNDKQVYALVQDLEVRFLGNHDPNVHFALLTDLPDSRELTREDSPLVDLCVDLIRELNEKYAGRGMGSFFLFHRHRIYNPREKCWMGFERKRGKLLDLNKLLRGQFDSFPVKVGDLSLLSRIRFVITLDSDTELPRGSAHRMIGTMAHPLNQAIIDPRKNIVVAGYGILQPRVGVSVQSTARSRLAAIYAGETGFDIYTRAVSDAYQDLYGEGIFTGKGIYEVETVHRVLDRRFPRNALLSHDLIEGAYARAGLASDIEVVEDYPSRYSAYNRRKHRWLRGDWQITGWLFRSVPDESGARVENPISLISRWKIFDNLRRSLVEPATFLLFVFGWLVLKGSPVYWTLAAIGILLLPAWAQFVLDLVRSAAMDKPEIAREAPGAWFAANLNVFFSLTFLPHQTLLALDAVVRTLVRRLFTRERLLEWETAAESEHSRNRSLPVDAYLNWMPVLAIGLGVLVYLARPRALAPALPVLLLWGCSKFISEWLNRPPVAPHNETSEHDKSFLRASALRTWRYFHEFSTEEHNWLIPDNVQEEPFVVAARVSPTNLGLLLNARQVACEFGYLTLPEFAEKTAQTLATISNLERYRGHLLNWYDTRTLVPLKPRFVSSVDNGNLLASLWSLHHGSLDYLRQPLLRPQLAEGFLDHLRILAELRALPRKQLSALEGKLRSEDALRSLAALQGVALEESQRNNGASKASEEAAWYSAETSSRLESVKYATRMYTPWFLPEFDALKNDPAVNLQLMETLALERLPAFIDKMAARLDSESNFALPEQKAVYQRLLALLPEARANILRLIHDLRALAAEAGKLAGEMDFGFLFNRRRKLMSVGFDVDEERLQPACYDLLATESRTAMFAAIAKEDIPQESWFMLGRAHTLDDGRPVLLSWTGTLFEYLMPSLWMRSYSNTLLERSRAAAVRSQRAYTAAKRIPWGISESAHSQRDEAGNYQYHAFGLPHLAMHKPEINLLVISPYSTYLSLSVDPAEALRNLRAMAESEWLGAYGFYDAIDYCAPLRDARRNRYQVVRCWMAHHQGMSLLALANFLNDNVIQQWFHSDRRVQATELLLHEKPIAYVRTAGTRGARRRISAA